MSDSKPRKTQPLGPLVRSGHVRLTVVSGPCPNGLSIGLGGSEHEIGRKNGDVILAEDLSVSVSHATLTKTKGRIEIADHSSNGTFLRVRGTAVLKAGDIIRTGNQLFRYDLVNPAESHPTADGTLLLTSPRRKGTFRLLQILEGGKPGLSATSSNNELTSAARAPPSPSPPTPTSRPSMPVCSAPMMAPPSSKTSGRPTAPTSRSLPRAMSPMATTSTSATPSSAST